jgi:hypothetical protein
VTRFSRIVLLAGIGAAALAACGEQHARIAFVSDTTVEARTRPDVQPLVVQEIARGDLLQRVAHRGLRRIEVWGRGEVPTHLAFRERITTDGRGKFSIEPIESLTARMGDWDRFDLLQRVREGFIFRYRDFAVRDQALNERNWRWTRLDEPAEIAGRLCERFRVERTDPSGVAYEVSIDAQDGPTRGMVLAYREFDSRGNPVCALEYESLELAPDLAGAVWHQSSNDERALDHQRDLAEQVEADVLVPRLAPRGYELRGAATIEDGDGQRWLRLTYLDGIEPLFFLQALTAAPTGLAGADWEAAALAPEPGTISVHQMGRASVLQGTLQGHRLIVVGKVGEAELLDLIESALP